MPPFLNTIPTTTRGSFKGPDFLLTITTSSFRTQSNNHSSMLLIGDRKWDGCLLVVGTRCWGCKGWGGWLRWLMRWRGSGWRSCKGGGKGGGGKGIGKRVVLNRRKEERKEEEDREEEEERSDKNKTNNSKLRKDSFTMHHLWTQTNKADCIRLRAKAAPTAIPRFISKPKAWTPNKTDNIGRRYGLRSHKTTLLTKSRVNRNRLIDLYAKIYLSDWYHYEIA